MKTALLRRRRGGVYPIRRFEFWFLATGAWDAGGSWSDAAHWSQVWFLASGSIDVFGNWDDSEAWV